MTTTTTGRLFRIVNVAIFHPDKLVNPVLPTHMPLTLPNNGFVFFNLVPLWKNDRIPKHDE
jgi:hypothetical protein